MARAVTAVVEAASLRVSVSLSGVTPDGPVEVWRAHSDGTRDLLRGLPPVYGGVSQVYDYLAPYTPVAGQLQFRYELTSGGTLYTSAWLDLVSVDVRLRAPAYPGTEAVVCPLRRPSVSMSRPQSIMEPIGRETPIVQSGVMQAGRFTLAVEVYSYAAARALERLLRMSPTVLLQRPAEMDSWQYVSVGTPERSPFADNLLPTVDGDVGSWMRYSLPCTVVDAPPGGIMGDPSASYQALVTNGWTYQQLLNWKGAGTTTYLDVIKGGF